MFRWSELKSTIRQGGCSISPASTQQSLTDHCISAWHDECPAVGRPQLPPADDGQNGVTLL